MKRGANVNTYLNAEELIKFEAFMAKTGMIANQVVKQAILEYLKKEAGK